MVSESSSSDTLLGEGLSLLSGLCYLGFLFSVFCCNVGASTQSGRPRGNYKVCLCHIKIGASQKYIFQVE